MAGYGCRCGPTKRHVVVAAIVAVLETAARCAGTGGDHAGHGTDQASAPSVPNSLRSGQFVPLNTPVGALACPQSLTTLQGIGFCVGITPLGAAPVGKTATGADLFVQCSGQHLGAREGSFMYRYPFLKRDPASGVPVFGTPISLPQDGVVPGNVSLVDLETKVVWAGSSGRVLAAAFSADKMHLLELHESGARWVWMKSYRYILPTAWSPPASSDRYSLVHGVSSAVVSRVTREGTSDGHNASVDWVVHIAVNGGESQRSNPAPSMLSKRSPGYQPYGGDGIFRGRLGLVGIGEFRFSESDASHDAAYGYTMVTPRGWSGGLMGLRVSSLNYRGRRYIVGGSRTGLLYVSATHSHNGSAAGITPVPIVDNRTGVLFASHVIGAAPVAYPNTDLASQTNVGDDLIVGGENGVEYVRLIDGDAAGLTGSSSQTQSHADILMMAQSSGPVLQNDADLVTGQTPTVSVCDFDHDGVLDIVAGTSEGRILFVRGTTDGYLAPVALRTGEGSSSETILVQGQYRIDVQGPEESRWGYTAPTCVDWNGDGLQDLVSSDNSALNKVYLRYRTSTGHLALRPAVPLMLDGLVLHGTWRNMPAVAPIGSKMALVTSDEQDEAHIYYRIDDHNLADGGKLWYRAPNETNSTHRPSQPLRHIQTGFLNDGGKGRLKYQLIDWDRDGLLDLLLGTCGYHSIPSNTTGLPACAPGARHNNVSIGKCGENGATVLLMRQINVSSDLTQEEQRQQKTQAGLVFAWPEWVTVRGARISYGGQENGVCAFDRGNGRMDMIIATPGGRHVYWASDDLGTTHHEPPVV